MMLTGETISDAIGAVATKVVQLWADASAAQLLAIGLLGIAALVLLRKGFFPRSHTRPSEVTPTFRTSSHSYKPNEYDAVIIGLSIAGAAVAKRLSDQGRKVLVIERELSKPDRIVGELMQPGGMEALKLLGMEECARSVGQTCTGYVAFSEGQEIILPYAPGYTGCSFHFGDFVMNLRQFITTRCTEYVTVVNGTALDLVVDEQTNRVTAVKYRATRPTSGAASEPEPTPVKALGKGSKANGHRGNRSPSPVAARGRVNVNDIARSVHREATDLTGNQGGADAAGDDSATSEVLVAVAPLVVLCDGSGSNFRRKVSRNADQNFSPHSHFVGLILKGVRLPYETKGHVFLGTTGPFLAYRLDGNEVRMLVDYKGPLLAQNKLPGKEVVQRWLQDVVGPQLPKPLQSAFFASCSDPEQIRSMPTPFFTQLFPKHKGFAAVGDHQNQRHPLTGGGMTCAFRDAIELTAQLDEVPDFFDDPAAVQSAIDRYTRNRCANVGCINILSWALYAVFEGPVAMRRACFHYFFLGGDAVRGPMSMLSGLRSSVLFLLYHYYRVIFYGTYLVMTHDPNVCLNRVEPLYLRLYWFAAFWFSPWRIWTTLHLLTYSTRVFVPLLFREFLPKGRFGHP